jgi:hypothetical protein
MTHTQCTRPKEEKLFTTKGTKNTKRAQNLFHENPDHLGVLGILGGKRW